MGYFDRKAELADKARKHTGYVANNFREEILNSIKSTYIVDDENVNPHEQIADWKINLEVWNADSVSAARILSERNTINDANISILNFASYKNPGGMFINGSSAQEECLCHESTLYNVLAAFDNDYYEWNRHHLNKSLYINRALVSPGILFLKDTNMVKDPTNFYATVITCAAPNFGPGSMYGHVTPEENSEVLNSRVKFVLDVASMACTDYLVLGAWGCGVFKQNPYEVAELFKKNLICSKYSFKKVVFAVPAGNENYVAFKKVFKGLETNDWTLFMRLIMNEQICYCAGEIDNKIDNTGLTNFKYHEALEILGGKLD